MTDFKTLLKMNSFSSDADARKLAAELLLTQYNFELQCVQMSDSVNFAHNGKGCTIAASKISDNVTIFQNVTIGANQTFNTRLNQWENLGNTVIGKNVVIADGAKIVGPIIIGDNSVIGTGAIITKDVPENSIAFGVNKIKPRDSEHDPIFNPNMPGRDDILSACDDVINRYNHPLS